MTSHLTSLQPHSVWSHFATLCEIPRPSRHEAPLRTHLVEWANERGIETTVDDAGNLILRKAASADCASAHGLILQAHLDMVCQANSGTAHDFKHDPILTVIRDGWVIAEETTLGADNGIGVALALAALDEPGLTHPAIEVLLTINEESGMDGARELAPGALRGTTLINLDTEEWGHFYLGCAGGMDVEVTHSCARQDLPSDHALLQFSVTGLRGGHSGIDIHSGRGNAVKLLAEALRDLSSHTNMQLIELNGGSARNAIPREAYAQVALPGDTDADQLNAWVQHRNQVWQQRFAQSDPHVRFSCQLITAGQGQALLPEARDHLLAFLDTVPNGVSLISHDFPSVTDTSSNLGVVNLSQGEFCATFKARSLHDARANELAEKLISHAQGYDLHAWKDGAYPGWTPNPSSPLLALCQRVYASEFGQPATLQVIHAGLECGLLAASHPQLDMISFGPDIRGAHAPGERVEIASVAHCWDLLKAILQALAKPAIT